MGEGLLLGDAQRLVGWSVLTKAGSALYIVLTLFIPLSPVVIGFDVTHRALRVGRITSPRTPRHCMNRFVLQKIHYLFACIPRVGR